MDESQFVKSQHVFSKGNLEITFRLLLLTLPFYSFILNSLQASMLREDNKFCLHKLHSVTFYNIIESLQYNVSSCVCFTLLGIP